MKILYIAPIPPPINGQSLASDIFLNYLLYSKGYEVRLIDFKKPPYKNKFGGFKRFFIIIAILMKVFINRSWADIVYITISESRLGNFKDLFTYFILGANLKKTVLHLHGGAGMAQLFSSTNILTKFLNRLFLKKVKCLVLLGKMHEGIFSGMVNDSRIIFVPNFAVDDVFVNSEQLVKKYDKIEKIQVLFLSNLIKGKGFNELRDSYLSLPENIRDSIIVNFAGGFKSVNERQSFLDSIDGCPGLIYHGIVGGKLKVKLLSECHVFCLPTYYKYEGQPISILEAYASGCFVITTSHSGISDIFKDGVNGYEVEIKSIESLKSALTKVFVNKSLLKATGELNHKYALKKFRVSNYNRNLIRAFE